MTGVALITGAGKRRVGSFVAEALAERGYSLVIHYRSSAAEATEAVAGYRARGVKAAAFPADLGDEMAVRGLVDGVLTQFGRIDVLVNCAAIWQRIPLETVSAADVRRHFEVNTLGTFLCSQRAGLAMVAQPEGGCIINLGDWAEARPYRDYAAYFASKGGVTALSRALAVELGTRNPRVRVNCILPGPVMFRAGISEADKEAAIASTLVHREGSPQHVAQAVLHFIDNDFLTGVCLPVDGGRTIYAAGE